MSDMKCPFCGQELEETMFARGRVFVSCDNPKCPVMDWGGCSKQIITELIRTRKALDVAINAIESAKDHNVVNCVTRGVSLSTDDVHITLYKALDKIKAALEQKD